MSMLISYSHWKLLLWVNLDLFLKGLYSSYLSIHLFPCLILECPFIFTILYIWMPHFLCIWMPYFFVSLGAPLFCICVTFFAIYFLEVYIKIVIVLLRIALSICRKLDLDDTNKDNNKLKEYLSNSENEKGKIYTVSYWKLKQIYLKVWKHQNKMYISYIYWHV